MPGRMSKQCPICQTANPARARFCMECGRLLSGSSPADSIAAPGGAGRIASIDLCRLEAALETRKIAQARQLSADLLNQKAVQSIPGTARPLRAPARRP